MESKKFELDVGRINKIRSYLITNSDKEKDIAFLGDHAMIGSPGYTYYLYGGCGIVLHNRAITIHGEDKKLIDEKFSELEKLSKDYYKIIFNNSLS